MIERIVEIFAPLYINGVKTNYSISDAGRIKNSQNKIISSRVTNTGYVQVHLSVHGIAKFYLMHRLVAGTFIPNPDNKPIVNHIDCNKQNNWVENLEWVTYSENNAHAIKTNSISNIGESSYKATISESTAHNICRMLSENVSITDISKTLNVNKSVIHHILYKQSWKQVSNKYNIDITKIAKNNVGSAHSGSKCSDSDIINIYRLRDKGYNISDIIDELNLDISLGHVRDICSGRRRSKLFNEYYNIK